MNRKTKVKFFIWLLQYCMLPLGIFTGKRKIKKNRAFHNWVIENRWSKKMIVFINQKWSIIDFWSESLTPAHQAKTRGVVAAISHRFLEYLSVICAKRNFKFFSTFIWRKIFCKGPDLWKRLQKKPCSNKFQCWNM